MRPLFAFLCLLCVTLLGFGGVAWRASLALEPKAAQERVELPAAGSPAPAGPPMKFGLDAEAVPLLDAALRPDYGTLWVGPWTRANGWGGTDAALRGLRDANVTPAVHLYYWGDDISPACLESGCNGKDRATWLFLAQELATHLLAANGDRPALVFLESEFNKASVATYEPLDGYLEEVAATLKRGNPAIQVVLAFGDWNSPAWTTWDRAAAASDATGLQAISALTRDSPERKAALFNSTLRGAETLRALFGKPVVLQDVAVASYPEPDALALQEEAIRRFADGLPSLKAAGVEAIAYRSLRDVPTMGTGHYFGEAERHFGLAWETGELKPAGKVWTAAMQRERGPAPA